MVARSIVPSLFAVSVCFLVLSVETTYVAATDDQSVATVNGSDSVIVTAISALDLNATNVDDAGNGTSTSLLQVYRQSQERFRYWLSDPYNHGIVMPAIIGVLAALTTVAMLCCINSCVKSSARRRRRRRIRNLADELKTDRKTLLGKDESDDEL
uniref:Transmembrane protein n=1 Tax=Plectus sambesii TaxID=2011161 RepID=A0A914WJ00_9BILA